MALLGLEELLLELLPGRAELRVLGGVRGERGGGVGRGVLPVAVEAGQVLPSGVDGAVDGALGGVAQAALLRLTQVVGDARLWMGEGGWGRGEGGGGRMVEDGYSFGLLFTVIHINWVDRG